MSVNPELDPWVVPMERLRSVLIQKGIISPRDTLDRSQLVALFHQHIKLQGSGGSTSGSPRKIKSTSEELPEGAYAIPSPLTKKVKETTSFLGLSSITICDLIQDFFQIRISAWQAIDLEHVERHRRPLTAQGV